MTAIQICQLAVKKSAQGICITYNEPTMNFQFILQLFSVAKRYSLFTSLKTNGYLSLKYWQKICYITDAMNIDFKGSSQRYSQLGAAQNAAKLVVQSINYAVQNRVHVQISIPVSQDFVYNDIKQFCLVKHKSIPIHLLKILPAYKMLNNCRTSDDKLLSVKAMLMQQSFHPNIYQY